MRLRRFCFLSLQLIYFSGVQAQETPDDSLKVIEQLKVARALSGTNPESADSLALVIFNSTKNVKWKGQASLIIAIANRLSNDKRCYAWSDTSLVYALLTNDFGTAGLAARVHGVSAGNFNKLEESLQSLLRSKQYLETANDTASIIGTLLSLSLLYHNDLKDYSLGKKYGLEALALSQQSGIKNLRWFINNTVAINYDDNNEPDMALKYHYDNLKLDVDSVIYAETHNNIGNTLLKTGRTNEALQQLKTANSLYKKYSTPYRRDYDFATILNNISCAHAFLGNRTLMEAYRDSAIYYAHRSANMEKLYDCYRDAYQNEERFGNFKQANIFLNRYILLKDSVYSSERARAIGDFEVQYETQKKEAEIKLLKASSQIKDLEFKQARNTIIIIIAVAGLIIFLSVRRKAQKDKLQRVKEKEEYQRKQFAAVLDGEERERARIARELHDGVGQLLSITKLSLTGVREELNEHDVLLDNAITSLDEATQEVRNVSHNLMPAILSTVGLEAALGDLTEKLNRSGHVQVTLDLAGLNQGIDKTTEIHIYRMIQEITNNILKYAGAQKIDILIRNETGRLEIVVRDDGRKLDINALETSSGIGWKNIRSRIAVMSGNVDIDSTDQNGTTLQITLSA